MLRPLRTVALATWAVMGLATACGDDDSGPSGPPCERLASVMCDGARECAAGSNDCTWHYASGSSLGRNCSVCEHGLIERFCNDPTKTAADIDACLGAIESGTCEAEPNGTGLRVPAACDAVLPCGGGPCKN